MATREEDPRYAGYKPPEEAGDQRAQDARYHKPQQDVRLEHGFSSSMVRKAWWTEVSRILEIQFVDGTRYIYRNMPRSIWDSFIEAPSAGAFVNKVLGGHPKAEV